jgi:hypothetical protein
MKLTPVHGLSTKWLFVESRKKLALRNTCKWWKFSVRGRGIFFLKNGPWSSNELRNADLTYWKGPNRGDVIDKHSLTSFIFTFQETSGKENQLRSPYLDLEFDEARKAGHIPTTSRTNDIGGSWSSLTNAGEATNLNLAHIQGWVEPRFIFIVRLQRWVEIYKTSYGNS